MTQLRETRRVVTPIEETFAYTSDFGNLAEWDPGIAASSRIGEGEIGVGSKFNVLVSFGSRETPMVYEMTSYEPPHRIVLRGTGRALTAVDDIRFTSIEEGTQIDYQAELEFSGFMRLLVPLMGPMLRNVGKKALDGLAAKLGSAEPG